jgi:hypothetical protein
MSTAMMLVVSFFSSAPSFSLFEEGEHEEFAWHVKQ